ncbi:MAG: aminotransferase class III-fold pyridoxal phosphate-dependent enzyme, partial [Flammeovirgaceae bacterium]|nr:aminotransferase class III-fold pyridoxal phosphate-dependent enzyme [Flammeovirgaceae bacterium]MDW8287267.1 aminotransferase class III-fold pyridoxal phosphate-dependent enzyme [Flammeovirgaceae bacterium]
REIRHAGLMMAVEFESFEVLKTVIDNALALGVLTDWFLYCNNSMRIAPPLIIEDAQIEEACHLIVAACR